MFSYGYWEEYPWKDELALQSERVVMHFYESLERNPIRLYHIRTR
jgi:hypothetical protein